MQETACLMRFKDLILEFMLCFNQRCTCSVMAFFFIEYFFSVASSLIWFDRFTVGRLYSRAV